MRVQSSSLHPGSERHGPDWGPLIFTPLSELVPLYNSCSGVTQQLHPRTPANSRQMGSEPFDSRVTPPVRALQNHDAHSSGPAGCPHPGPLFPSACRPVCPVTNTEQPRPARFQSGRDGFRAGPAAGAAPSAAAGL